MSDKLTKAFSSEITPSEGERCVTATITTSSVDRDGESIVAQGMNSKNFEMNPVIMLGHDYFTLPIGKCVSLKRVGDSVVAKMQFAERPTDYPEGKEWVPDTLLSLYQQKVMNAFSIGFVPIEARAATTKDIETYGANCKRVYSKWELLEVSAVPIPANQDAVAMAVSKGLMGAEMASKVWGVTKAPEKVAEIEVKPAAKLQVQVETPRVQPKRVVVVQVEEDMSRLVNERIQKAKGRIYLA